MGNYVNKSLFLDLPKTLTLSLIYTPPPSSLRKRGPSFEAINVKNLIDN